jgi:uncharacterized DUF497 family protein
METFTGFEWDTANAGHVLRHDVLPQEVEETANGRHVIIPARTVAGEARWRLYGKTAANRYLAVVFTIRERRFRAVTAYDMNVRERRSYAAQID